jgi:hypothetical protein
MHEAKARDGASEGLRAISGMRAAAVRQSIDALRELHSE